MNELLSAFFFLLVMAIMASLVVLVIGFVGVVLVVASGLVSWLVIVAILRFFLG